ncbi:8-amino-7-oxononanoate synthase [Pedobacter psychrophilus]|uniref:8-amino-7-oxononanoate synthase n=1 Tax=Pedobacter psychrophilus TaxID=1826909 RepID=A0A179DCI4_9SPHI|nr:pyridoxal phosphate-dependent aminotransferase family protein [Pedobacter psychrophilus]OAQ38173.1 8-amino-7-oxononanoate synthase [Pedobacter psychrophilus]
MDSFLKDKLAHRIQNNSLRVLKNRGHSLVDFSSNDYLGFARNANLKAKIDEELKKFPDYLLGSTGSRLLSGNLAYAEVLETEIAKIHHAEAGLIFNSGYDANVGLLSSIAKRGDTLICDELLHASLIDGARLSNANRYVFKHNDLNSLSEKLKNAKGNIFIITESVFSMDGDIAPLKEISALAKKFNANLIVDEAHALGVIGNNGLGLVQQLGLEKEVFARIHTFGKALGCHGAIILGSEVLRSYLINFARSFIYTTALPFHSLATIKIAYQSLKNGLNIKENQSNISYFNSIKSNFSDKFIESKSAIQSLIIAGNDECKILSINLLSNGFDVKAILSPTVAEGKERLRICLHAFNTKDEIEQLLSTIKKLK